MEPTRNIILKRLQLVGHVMGMNGNGVSKKALKGYTCCVQALRSPKEAFAAAMQSCRERCEKCVCLQGVYVEK